jgi:hypothetical protein
MFFGAPKNNLKYIYIYLKNSGRFQRGRAPRVYPASLPFKSIFFVPVKVSGILPWQHKFRPENLHGADSTLLNGGGSMLKGTVSPVF